MLISTHVLSGALVGRLLGRPLPALLLGAVSHLVLDGLPHWGHAGGWPPQPLEGSDFRVAAVDGLCGLGLIARGVRVTPPGARLAVLSGIVGACAPDLDKPALRWWGRSPWPAGFDRFHAGIQVDVERPSLLRQDAVIAALAAIMTMRLLRLAPQAAEMAR